MDFRLFFKKIKVKINEKKIEQEWPDYKIVNKSVFVQIQLRLLEYTPFDNFKKIIPLLENDSLRQKPMKKKIRLDQSIFEYCIRIEPFFQIRCHI